MKEKQKPKICLQLTSRTVEEIRSELDIFGDACDAVEWRTDKNTGLQAYEPEAFVQMLRLIKTLCKGKTFFFSYTPEPGKEEEGYQLLRHAMGIVDFLDLDVRDPLLRQLLREARRKHTRVLLTYSEMEKILTKEEISTAFLHMEKFPVDMLAILSFANTEEDAYAMLEGAYAYNQLRRHKPFLAIAMGEEGQASRICGGDFGSVMTYAGGSRITEPGQFNAHDLKRYMDMYYK